MAEGTSRISLLDVDRELAAPLAPPEARAAREAVRVRVTALAAGGWEPSADWAQEAGAIGFLLLEGFIVRDVELVERHASEILGQGDLLRPDVDGEEAPVPFAVRWTVVEPARVALIDREATVALGRWPELVATITADSSGA